MNTMEFIDFVSTNKIALLLFSLAIVYMVYIVLAHITKKALLLKSKTKKEKRNVGLFVNLIKYIFVIISFLVVIFVLTGSLAGLGVSAGLLTAALGWALQRPITGVAGWIMILVRKPFQIGDRIEIAGIIGDVTDVSLTHIYLGEVGGTIASEELSGRVILIPNSILFEQKIINYTLQDEFILDEAVTSITFDSDIEKAKKIILSVANKFVEEKKEVKPYIRLYQFDSGIKLKVRYKVRAEKRIEVLSKIHTEIVNKITKAKGVHLAYQHIKVVK